MGGDMDFSVLAEQLVEVLRPYLGVLLSAGVGAVGKDAWGGLKDLWARLSGKIEGDPQLKQAAQTVAEKPTDVESAAALKQILLKLLENDPALAGQLQPIVSKIFVGRDSYVGNTIKSSPGANIGPR